METSKNIATHILQRGYTHRPMARVKANLKSWAETQSVEQFSCRYFTLPPTTKSAISICFSPDGLTFASTHGDHTVKIVCFSTGEILQTLEGHPRTPWTVKYNPRNSQMVASGCLGFQVRVWDCSIGECLYFTQLNHAIISVAFHPYADVLAVASGRTLSVWDYEAPSAPRHVWQSGQSLRCVRFMPSGKAIITGEANDPPQGTRQQQTSNADLTVRLQLWSFNLEAATNGRYSNRLIPSPRGGSGDAGARNRAETVRGAVQSSQRYSAFGGAMQEQGRQQQFQQQQEEEEEEEEEWDDDGEPVETPEDEEEGRQGDGVGGGGEGGTGVAGLEGLGGSVPPSSRLRPKKVLHSPSTILSHALLYNDGGMDVSECGRFLAACAQMPAHLIHSYREKTPKASSFCGCGSISGSSSGASGSDGNAMELEGGAGAGAGAGAAIGTAETATAAAGGGGWAAGAGGTNTINVSPTPTAAAAGGAGRNRATALSAMEASGASAASGSATPPPRSSSGREYGSGSATKRRASPPPLPHRTRNRNAPKNSYGSHADAGAGAGASGSNGSDSSRRSFRWGGEGAGGRHGRDVLDLEGAESEPQPCLAMVWLTRKCVGQTLRLAPHPGARGVTSVKLSPTSSHVLLGYGVRDQPSTGRQHGGGRSVPDDGGNGGINGDDPHRVASTYRSCASELVLQTELKSRDDDVNIAIYHPLVAHGFVYGTKQGNLRAVDFRRISPAANIQQEFE